MCDIMLSCVCHASHFLARGCVISCVCHASHFLARECVISCYHVCVMLLISWYVSARYHVIMCVPCFSFPGTWVCNIMLSCVCHASHSLARECASRQMKTHLKNSSCDITRQILVITEHYSICLLFDFTEHFNYSVLLIVHKDYRS